MDQVKDWASLAAVLIAIGSAVFGWFAAGGKKADAALAAHRKDTDVRFEKFDQRMDDWERDSRLANETIAQRFSLLDTQLARIEEGMKHMPDRESSRNLELAIEKLTGRLGALDERLSGRMETLDERLKPVAAIGDRLQEFLLEQACK